MSTIYFYTLFDSVSGKPRTAGFKINDKIIIYDLYRPGAGKTIRTIKETLNKIKEFIILSNDKGHTIVTSNFKNIINAYDLPLATYEYNIYDTHIDFINTISPTNSQSKDNLLVRKVLDKLSTKSVLPYQKLIANAAVVYQDLENKGLYVNDQHMKPIWSMFTYSGRSKTSQFNAQGLTEDLIVRAVDSSPNDVLLYFDWISADIRAASMLAADDILYRTFEITDPYTEMIKLINDPNISREHCKKYLLKSINSMDVNSQAFQIFPKLGEWINKCYETTSTPEGILCTLLGRRFRVSQSKNALAVLNGAMQGTVAHAMHSVIRKIWERLSTYLLVEIHDSVVLSVPSTPSTIRSVINIVSPIMMYPFKDILDNNPSFPIRVSVGKKWKRWKLLETHRESGVIRA